jgi:hypothetical protein
MKYNIPENVKAYHTHAMERNMTAAGAATFAAAGLGRAFNEVTHPVGDLCLGH